MTELSVSAPATPAVRKNGRPPKVSGKLVVALKAIAWEGMELQEAAQAAGLTTRALRYALEKRHVIAALREQREVFRAYVSAQNIHHAKELRDSSGNAMAKLGAMKYIDSIDDQDPVQRANRAAPGVVIQIIGNGAHMPHVRQIEAKPLITNDPHSQDNDESGE